MVHLTTHTLLPLPAEKIAPCKSDSITGAFAKTLLRDVYVNAYLQAKAPEKLVDIAFANAMAYQKIKPAQRIFTRSTKVMAAALNQNQRRLSQRRVGRGGVGGGEGALRRVGGA